MGRPHPCLSSDGRGGLTTAPTSSPHPGTQGEAAGVLPGLPVCIRSSEVTFHSHCESGFFTLKCFFLAKLGHYGEYLSHTHFSGDVDTNFPHNFKLTTIFTILGSPEVAGNLSWPHPMT